MEELEAKVAEYEEEIEGQRLEIERLKGLVKGYEQSFALLKCRDCLFKTNDPIKLLEHMETLEHMDYTIIIGNDVKADWISLEVKRKEPEV